ncbi:MAG: hypothetical protein KatS3mg087_2200 [Patescibacteria group bacterium]|nr:MAG: hypothetical protein KatS3mg087_2200 [Patescibacteria group bacterium]
MKITFVIENLWESLLMLSVADISVPPRRRLASINLTEEQIEALGIREVGRSQDSPVYEEIIDVFIDHDGCKYIPCDGEDAAFDCDLGDGIVLSFIIADTWSSHMTYMHCGYKMSPPRRKVKITLNESQKAELNLSRVGTSNGAPVYETISDCFIEH